MKYTVKRIKTETIGGGTPFFTDKSQWIGCSTGWVGWRSGGWERRRREGGGVTCLSWTLEKSLIYWNIPPIVSFCAKWDLELQSDREVQKTRKKRQFYTLIGYRKLCKVCFTFRSISPIPIHYHSFPFTFNQSDWLKTWLFPHNQNKKRTLHSQNTHNNMIILWKTHLTAHSYTILFQKFSKHTKPH